MNSGEAILLLVLLQQLLLGNTDVDCPKDYGKSYYSPKHS